MTSKKNLFVGKDEFKLNKEQAEILSGFDSAWKKMHELFIQTAKIMGELNKTQKLMVEHQKGLYDVMGIQTDEMIKSALNILKRRITPKYAKMVLKNKDLVEIKVANGKLTIELIR